MSDIWTVYEGSQLGFQLFKGSSTRLDALFPSRAVAQTVANALNKHTAREAALEKAMTVIANLGCDWDDTAPQDGEPCGDVGNCRGCTARAALREGGTE